MATRECGRIKQSAAWQQYGFSSAAETAFTFLVALDHCLFLRKGDFHMIQSAFAASHSAFRVAYRIYPRYPRQALASITCAQKVEAVAYKAESALSALATLA